MRITCISIFPEIFSSFTTQSLIAKAIESWTISIDLVDPRTFCTDKHQQVDDYPYGGGAGLVIKAQPVIDAIKSVMTFDARIVFVAPSTEQFVQTTAVHAAMQFKHIIFVCWRYEGIDQRAEDWARREFPERTYRRSIGQFVTLWGEIPTQCMIEAIVRLIPWVIQTDASHLIESYSEELWAEAIEYPQYTRPESVEWMSVPEVLLSGHHKMIEEWREQQTT